jgi:hypothetical protein
MGTCADTYHVELDEEGLFEEESAEVLHVLL